MHVSPKQFLAATHPLLQLRLGHGQLIMFAKDKFFIFKCIVIKLCVI